MLHAGLIIVGVLLVAGAVPKLITSGASVVQHNVQEASYDMQLDTSAYDAWSEGSNALIGLGELARGLALIAWSSRVAGRLWSGRPPSLQAEEHGWREMSGLCCASTACSPESRAGRSAARQTPSTGFQLTRRSRRLE